MDSLRTEPKRCTKKSCKTMILPPGPNEKDYNTCENCRARDAASKKRKREGAAARESYPQQEGPVERVQDGSPSAANKVAEDSRAVDGEKSAKVRSNHTVKYLYLLSMLRQHLLSCTLTVRVYLTRYGMHSWRSMWTSLVPITYWKTHWSVIARGLE